MIRYLTSWASLIILILSCNSGHPTSEDASSQPGSHDSLSIVSDSRGWQLPPGWIDLGTLDSSMIFEMRYADTNNFVSEKLYPCARCLLREEPARSLLKAQRLLRTSGLSLKIFDCYRPLSVQEHLWAKVPDAKYVTPPERGSMHNRGIAVDLTLVDENGVELDMGTAFDFFGPEAHHTYRNLPAQVLDNRKHLMEVMQLTGFQEIRTEWWHYSYKDQDYPLENFIWSCND